MSNASDVEAYLRAVAGRELLMEAGELLFDAVRTADMVVRRWIFFFFLSVLVVCSHTTLRCCVCYCGDIIQALGK